MLFEDTGTVGTHSASLNRSGFLIEKYVRSVKGKLLERHLEMLTWTKTVGS